MPPPDERRPAAAIPSASVVDGTGEDQVAICDELIGGRCFCEWHE